MDNSQKNFVLLLLIGFLVLALLVFSFARAKPYFNETDVGRKVTIRWEEVNVRNGYSTSKEVITSLTNGEIVVLTGYFFEYAGGSSSSPTESWVEIQLEDGTTGWIVRRSIIG